MSPLPFWSGPRKGHLGRVLLFYLGGSWLVIQVVSDLRETLKLPDWIGPVALILLLIGLVITLATAWAQSHQPVDQADAATGVPRPWSVDLGSALDAVRRGRLPRLTWGRALVGGIVSFGLLFGTAGLFVVLRHGPGLAPGLPSSTSADGVAVLPFSVHGAAVADWREGMVDLVSTGLDGAGGLRAIASRTVLARWRELVPDTGEVDEQTALNVARRLHARYALLGTAVAIGPTVRLSVVAYELNPDAARLGQLQVQGPAENVLALVDSLSLQTLALLLQREPRELQRVELASVTTPSLPALKAYLEGESHFRLGEFEAAADAFGRAVAMDSTFGLAFYRLAECYGWSENIGSERGAEASRRAMRLVDRMPERVERLVRGEGATARNDPAAVEILREAVKKHPDDAEAWHALGDAYLHVRGALYGWEEAEQAFQQAADLAPRFAPYRIHLVDEAFVYYADSAMVAQRLGTLERLAPRSAVARRYRLAADLAFGDSATRAAAFGMFLDSADQTDFRSAIANSLAHPRLFDGIGERLMQAAAERGTPESRAKSSASYARALVDQRGRLQDALAIIETPALPVPTKITNLFTLHAMGLPIPLARLDSLARHPAAGEIGVLVAAARAAERGRPQRLERLASVVREATDSLATAGDTSGADELRANAGVMRGFALWREGRTDAAIRTLEANRLASGTTDATWLLGILHLQAGRPSEAVPYFRSLMTWTPNPLAAYYLGLAYQAQDDSQDAR
ncbi:MAG: tetratricopeptide repeat protein, partial [Gemmatimonadota bacterium]